MCSCEYFETGIKEENRRTKIIRVKNIKFKSKGKNMKLNSHSLESTDMVMIIFKFQKNDWQSKSVICF